MVKRFLVAGLPDDAGDAQIFIDGANIGGSDDLLALEQAGQLDRKLGIGGP